MKKLMIRILGYFIIIVLYSYTAYTDDVYKKVVDKVSDPKDILKKVQDETIVELVSRGFFNEDELSCFNKQISSVKNYIHIHNIKQFVIIKNPKEQDLLLFDKLSLLKEIINLNRDDRIKKIRSGNGIKQIDKKYCIFPVLEVYPFIFEEKETKLIKVCLLNSKINNSEDASAWTLDKDIVNPSDEILHSYIFLNKKEFNALKAFYLDMITASLRSSIGGENLFSWIIEKYGKKYNMDMNNTESMYISHIVPEIIRNTPTEDNLMLKMTDNLWNDWSKSQQQKFIEEINNKINKFNSIITYLEESKDLYYFPVTFDMLSIRYSELSRVEYTNSNFMAKILLLISIIMILIIMIICFVHLSKKRLKQSQTKTSTHNENVVFICYAREDTNMAIEICSFLKKNNITIWIDTEGLYGRGGIDWKRYIKSVIKKSAVFLALFSNKSITKRGFVHTEIQIALDICKELPNSHIFIIPIRLDKCKPCDCHHTLESLHWVDFFGSDEERKKGLNELLRSIQHCLKKQEEN